MNLSAISTVSGGKYDLKRFDASTLETGSFVDMLLKNKQVMYNWGAHHLFSCAVPFRVNHADKTIVDMDEKPIDETSWIGIDPDYLHLLLADVFEGEWGPTATDIIIQLLQSGIEVDIYNTKHFGPKDPNDFLSELRKRLNT